MALGTIDRATAVMVPVFLTYDSADKADAWARNCALEFTVISLFTEHIAFSPNPTRDQSIAGLWGEFVSGLPGYTKSEASPTVVAEAQALAEAHLICSDPKDLTNALRAAKADPSYPAWLDWHARYQLVEHANRLNGLFDFQFLEQIAQILNVSPQEMKRLWDHSRDTAAVAQLCKRIEGDKVTGDDALIVEAWLTSTLMRGVYHDELARIRGRQNYRHPVRSFRTKERTKFPLSKQFYEPNPAEKYFSAVLLGLSLRASRSPSERVRLFNQNAMKSRQARISGELALGAREDNQFVMSEENGLERASREVNWLIRQGALDAGGARISNSIEIATNISSSAFGFYLTPWAGLATGAVSAVAQVMLHPGERFTTAWRSRENGLRKLATAVAGPIDVPKK